MLLAEVALPVPLARAFTYAVPPELAGRVLPGARVVCPLGGRRVVGLVLGVREGEGDAAKLKAVASVVGDEPAVPADLLALLVDVARYYFAPIGEVALSARDLCLQGKFHGVSFDLRKGEILGVAGLVGSGRSNVAETLFGVTPATSGAIQIDGKEIAINKPGVAMDAGMAFLTEDRKASGCFLLLDIMANMQIALLRHGHATAGFVNERKIEALCQEQKARLRVRTPDLEEPIINLSGGNQQKVLIARWLLTRPRILILDEPTRGIDVGAKAEIHKLITELAVQGVAVFMISSELPEVLGMSDRILVMHEGRMTGIVDRKDATQVRIMELASQ